SSHGWSNQFPGDSQSPEDSWSNSSRGQGGPVAPTTLNVEDWFQFCGINGGDIGAMNTDGM
ncbi:MAG: hypothetical protein Q9214_006614, partial [Letrouitia sp. 1 TL-2023]